MPVRVLEDPREASTQLTVESSMPWNPYRGADSARPEPPERRRGELAGVFVSNETRNGMGCDGLLERQATVRGTMGGTASDMLLGGFFEVPALKDQFARTNRFGDRADVCERPFRVVDTDSIDRQFARAKLTYEELRPLVIRCARNEMGRVVAWRLPQQHIDGSRFAPWFDRTGLGPARAVRSLSPCPASMRLVPEQEGTRHGWEHMPLGRISVAESVSLQT